MILRPKINQSKIIFNSRGTTPPNGTHLFLKISGCALKLRTFNQIELVDTYPSFNKYYAFDRTLFICYEFNKNITLTDEFIHQNFDQILRIKFSIWTKEDELWHKIICDINNLFHLNFNPFYKNLRCPGRRVLDNVNLSLVPLFCKSELLSDYQKTLHNTNLSIYLKVTLIDHKNCKFVDYIEIPFKQRKQSRHVNFVFPNTEEIIPKYSLNKLMPNKAMNGSIICLEGNFPPLDHLKIIFGTTEITPNFYHEKRITCKIPDGHTGQIVPVLFIYNNIISETHLFCYE